MRNLSLIGSENLRSKRPSKLKQCLAAFLSYLDFSAGHALPGRQRLHQQLYLHLEKMMLNSSVLSIDVWCILTPAFGPTALAQDHPCYKVDFPRTKSYGMIEFWNKSSGKKLLKSITFGYCNPQIGLLTPDAGAARRLEGITLFKFRNALRAA